MDDQITILGWTDDVLDCDVCGKPLNRQRTLAYEIDGSVQYAGTSCAAKVAGMTAAKVRAAANRIERDKAAEAAAERRAAWEVQRQRRMDAEARHLTAVTGRPIRTLRDHAQVKTDLFAGFDGYADIQKFCADVDALIDG